MMKSFNYLERAEKAVKYFQWVMATYPNNSQPEVWQLGLETSSTWLQLLKEASPSTDEISTLLIVVGENWNKSIMWSDLTDIIFDWAIHKGFPVSKVVQAHNLSLPGWLQKSLPEKL